MRKEVADIHPSEVRKDRSSMRPALKCYEGNLWGAFVKVNTGILTCATVMLRLDQN